MGKKLAETNGKQYRKIEIYIAQGIFYYVKVFESGELKQWVEKKVASPHQSPESSFLVVVLGIVGERIFCKL